MSTWRRSATAGRSLVHIEPPRIDELHPGIPAPQRTDAAVISRDELGRPADSASARKLGAMGGSKRAGQSRLARGITLGATFADPRFEKYASAARAFRRLHVSRLAREVGGGHCGPAPASIIASAALQLAASRFAFEVLGDMVLGSRLANDSRQNLLAAHELAAREAASRPSRAEDAQASLVAAFGAPGAGGTKP